MIDLSAVRSYLDRALELADTPDRVDVEGVAKLGARLVEALEELTLEAGLLRDIVSDLDELMVSEEGPLLQPDHTCRTQRRVAQWYREVWKPNYAARGHQIPQRVWGRGR